MNNDLNTLIHDTNGPIGRIRNQIFLIKKSSYINSYSESNPTMDLFKRLDTINSSIDDIIKAIDYYYSKAKEIENGGNSIKS